MAKEKKDVSEQVRSDVTMLEEIRQLKKDVAEYKKDGDEMGREILYLRKQNAALRGVNKQLKERVEHYRHLDLEGDVLYENKIDEAESLLRELRTVNEQRINAEKAFHLAKEQEKRLLARIDELATENYALRKEMECLKEKKPWYKRIF